MTVPHECLDNDSPWLICKRCGAVGRCEKDPSPQPESVPELRALLQTLGLWIAEALTVLDTVEPECSTEAELLKALIRRGEMLVLASLARSGAAHGIGPAKDAG